MNTPATTWIRLFTVLAALQWGAAPVWANAIEYQVEGQIDFLDSPVLPLQIGQKVSGNFYVQEEWFDE
ncbi:MAG: hypothetical protein AB7G75_17165 [Candidatus Binatia bacterium]